MKDKIICIIGESGSGKNTIADLLAARLNWNKIKSYTTREKRFDGEDTHTFIEMNDIEKRYFNNFLLEDTRYVFRDDEIVNKDVLVHEELYGEHYFMTRPQYKNKGTSIYVTSPRGAEQTKMNADCEVVTVYLQADGINRLDRLSKRWHKMKNLPEYSEEGNFLSEKAIKLKKEIVDERMRRDKSIFNTINQVDHVVDANDDIETVYERVRGVIK